MQLLRVIVLSSVLAVGGVNTRCHAGAPSENQWGPFFGRVVDAETGRPIAGAIFVVIWMRSIPTPVHAKEQFDDARVAVTDVGGHFELPQRDPPLVRSSIENPYVACVAPGYEAARLTAGAERTPPISTRLRRLSAAERRRYGNGWASELGLIPYDRRAEFATAVNTRRRQMGLGSVDLLSGVL